MHDQHCTSTSRGDIHRQYHVPMLAMSLPAGSHTTKPLRSIINTLMQRNKILQIRSVQSTKAVHKESGHDVLRSDASEVQVSKAMPACMGYH